MKNIIQLTLIQILVFTSANFAHTQSDSLIRFSDLRYHSEFEREAIHNYYINNIDTFNLFLAIDENMTNKDATIYEGIYLSIFRELENKKIHNKKINQKVRLSYSTVHSRFLNKYNDNEYFPVIFQSGTYNCVSASMLFAMVLDSIKIPYKIKASSNHVYLVANPGSNSIVIETTNPGFEKTIFTGEFKQQYVNYLRTSKLISESEYRNKSVEEIFEEKFKEVRDAEFKNLPGFQYYNKALTRLQNNQAEEALKLCQKAYFFYPDNQIKTLLFTSLLLHLERCGFEEINDIDNLMLLSRFENTDLNVIVGIFNHIIFHQLQYIDKEAFCDSLYQRLISQMSDKKAIEEISFTYNMQMSYHYQNSDKVEKYVEKALEIKGNHHDANVILENHLRRKLYSIYDLNVLIDTINQLEFRYKHSMITSLLSENKLRAYLQLANDSFGKNKISEGNRYLLEFEKNCELPLNSPILSSLIENTYRTMALHYFYSGNKSQAKNYVNRGLKYVPDSRLLKSVLY